MPKTAPQTGPLVQMSEEGRNPIAKLSPVNMLKMAARNHEDLQDRSEQVKKANWRFDA
jgi:hypothetical protein